MKTFFNKEEILHRIKSELRLSTDTELAEFLGVNKSTLANWVKRNSMDWELVFSKCERFDFNWLITGKGSIYKNNNERLIAAESPAKYEKKKSNCTHCQEKERLITELIRDKDELRKDKDRLSGIIDNLLNTDKSKQNSA